MDGKVHRLTGTVFLLLASVLSAALFTATILAVEAEKKPAEPAKPESTPLTKDELAQQQQQIAEKYRRFEEVILRMAELTASSDPKRAALLRRAAAQSKENLIGLQLEKLAEVIRKGPLGTAVKNQTDVEQELDQLLQLLLTEQRQDRVKEERERLKQQIRKIKELINRQTELKGQTDAPGDVKQLAPQQGKLADETARLSEEMKAAGKPDASKAGKPTDAKKADAKPGDQPADGKKGEGDQKSDGKKSDEGKSPGDSKSGDSGKSGEKNSGDKSKSDGKSKSGSKSKSGESSPGQQGADGDSKDQKDQQAQQPQSPGQQRVAAAQQRMQDAQKKLDQAKKEGAQEDQEEAIRELEKAKAELEEILRQLREEELARTLAQLEQRFREMLALQHEVYEGTKRLHAVPEERRGPNDEVESGRLSRKESVILLEAEKALAVLRDEGSAVAFPEAVEMMRDDMQQVVAYLARFKVDQVTQGVEEDIIAALEEMIAALQKAQKEQEQRKQQPPGQSGQPPEPPLVDQLAELKMIRALQMRVNTRTKRYQKLVSGPEGQADQPELLKAIKDLAEREQRIFQTTRDIVVGKNK